MTNRLIRLGQSNCPFSTGHCKQDSHFAWNQNLNNTFQKFKKIILGLVKKDVMTILSNLSHPRLEQKRHEFSVVAKALYMPNWESPNLLSWGWHIIFAIDFGPVSSVHQWSGRLEFNPRSSHTKDFKKMVLDTSLLNTQHFKVLIKGKVEQSRERSSTLPYTLV